MKEKAMKKRSLVAAANYGFMFLLVVGFAAEAAEIKVLSALAMKPVMEDLGPKFERATGHKLAITFVTLGEAVKRVQGGETADVAMLPKQGVDTFVKDGKAATGSVTAVASSGNGVAIRKGSPKPDISSPEALKRTLLAAKSITYTPLTFGGTSGPHIVKVFERLGIADEMKSKTIFPKVAGGAAVGALVASGEAELGLQQIQELIPVAGIEIVGPLPGDLQNNLLFAAAVMTGAKDAEASTALINFLHTPEAAAVIKAKGMEPNTP
jgi:molybdate transport system substrate-binding protein